ncbi:MAG: Rrf2 family transcriptional regulator [Clostridiales bacterium]|jgi:Rrf2 family protein|nr:Rrf2 family transcriptional regulator [Clostridiales bacterium]
MKISTRGRYGLKAMIDLDIESGGGKCICLKSIAERQGIPENYLEQIIAILKKAGFVKSIRGAQGGYILNKPSNEITVGDILRALEGSLSPVNCVESGDAACGTGDCGTCPTKSVWGKIYNSLNDVVDSITLEDLARDSRAKGEQVNE